MSEVLPGLNINSISPPFHLSVEEYNDLLLTNGSGAEYRRAINCPCVRIETRQAALDCQVCRGLGRVYPARLREPLIVLDTSRTATMKWAAAGLMAQGNITLTFPCGIIPGIGDMVLPSTDVHVVQEYLFRDGTRRVSDDQLRDRRTRADHRKVPLKGRDAKLLYPDPDQIECVVYIDDAGELVFALPSIDYKLHNDGRLTWLADKGPASGHAVTVRYRAPAAYVIHNSGPILRRENSENMPYRVMAQRLDKIEPDDLR
jgi:hypothetical protein